jgi:hypothetical protein
MAIRSSCSIHRWHPRSYIKAMYCIGVWLVTRFPLCALDPGLKIQVSWWQMVECGSAK